MEDQKKKSEKEKTDQKLTRRDFIIEAGKFAGIAALGISIAACGDDNESSGSSSLPAGSDSSTGEGSDGPVVETSNTYSDEFDVVVVGTGMGGASAGAIAALNGLRTLVLEKNPRPGGSCSYYERDGFHVDTGAHMFIQANAGPFGKLTRRLQVPRIDFINAFNTLELKGINMDFTVPGSGRLPGRVLTVPQILYQIKINPIHYPAILALIADIMLMPPRQVEKWDHVSLEEFIMRFTRNEEVRSILSGVLGLMIIMPADQASAGESIWNLQRLLWSLSVSYPRGGCSAIPETFLQGAEKYGAEVHMSTGVEKIIVKDDKVEGVILSTGEKIKTSAVISTTSVKDTVLRMVGEDYFPYSYIEQVNAIVPSFTAVQAKIGLKKKLVNAGCLAGGIPLEGEKDLIGKFTHTAFANAGAGIVGDYIPIYAPVPTNFDENLAPPGHQLITAVALAPTLDIELQDDANDWIDGMMDALRQMVPELDENTVFCDTWSIKDLAAWTGKSDGAAISTGQSIDQVGSKRIGHETPIEGLYLAGDCAGPARGVGTELACQSGMDCADLVTRHFSDLLLKKIA